jgi:short-subunit dehydrogenase
MNQPISDWRGQRIWIIGASSGIGAALARQALSLGAHVAISARRLEQLELVAADHPTALVVAFDVLEMDAWGPAYLRISQHWGGIDLVFFCAADYQPLRSWEVTAAIAERTLRLNLMSVYTGLAQVLPDMLTRQSGGVAIIASVAGYLGLPNASVYGPSKAALINLSEVLYSDLHPQGINVYLINPGFVSTRLTQQNTFSMPALQTPQQAAKAIWHGISVGQFEIHFPRRFSYFLKLLQLLPYRLRFALLAHLNFKTKVAAHEAVR